MQNLIIAITYSIVLAVLSIFLLYRLGVGQNRRIGGTGFIYAGLIIIFAASLTNLIKHLPEYSAWFYPGVYGYIDLGMAATLILGIIILIVGLSLYFSYWGERDFEVTAHLEKLRLLDNIQQESRFPYPLLELLDRALKSMLNGMGEEAGAIFLLDRSQRKFVLATGAGLSKEETALLEYYPYGRNIVSQSIEEQTPLISSDFRSLGGKAQLAASMYQSILVMPLISGKNKIGAMLLFSHDERHFTRDYISIVSPITEWLSEKIEVNRLNRDLAKSRREIEYKDNQLSGLTRKLEQVIKFEGDIPTPSDYTEKCIGLIGAEDVFLVGLANGKLVIHGGTSPVDEFSDNFKVAVINALGRKKAVILNQESTDDSGHSFISKSTLLLPADNKGNALLLRKTDGAISTSNDELQALDMIAAVSGMVIANSIMNAVSLARRKGIRAISDVLQTKITHTRHDKILKSFMTKISDTISENHLTLLFKRDRLSLKLQMTGEVPSAEEKIVIAIGEGPSGRAAALRVESAYFDTKSIIENLAEYDDENRNKILTLLGERKHPSFQADYPVIIKGQTEYLISLFGFNETLSENHENHHLISLLVGLLNLRFELTLAEKPDAKQKYQSADAYQTTRLREIRDYLTEISGQCRIALQDKNSSGAAAESFKSILEITKDMTEICRGEGIKEKRERTREKDATNLNLQIKRMFEENSISGNLHMIEGRPMAVNLNLKNIPESFFSNEQINEFLKLTCKSFIQYVNEDEIISVNTYLDKKHIYLDMSKHRENFPPVEPVAGFGRYMPPGQIEGRMENREFLKLLSQFSGEFAFDRHSEKPSYFSFKIPSVPIKKESAIIPEAEGITILAVDDQAVILELLEAMCQSMGHKIYTARNGQEGLQLFRTYQPDIVITDLVMPGMTGIELAARIKNYSPETPIVIITGWGTPINRDKISKIGINHILYKPFRLEQLSDVITKIKQFDLSN